MNAVQYHDRCLARPPASSHGVGPVTGVFAAAPRALPPSSRRRFGSSRIRYTDPRRDQHTPKQTSDPLTYDAAASSSDGADDGGAWGWGRQGGQQLELGLPQRLRPLTEKSIVVLRHGSSTWNEQVRVYYRCMEHA